MEELIREGPSGGPNREKVLQELRASRASTSTSTSSGGGSSGGGSQVAGRGRCPYGRTRPRADAGSSTGVVAKASGTAVDAPADDGVLPDESTAPMGAGMGGMYGGGMYGGGGMGGMGGMYGMYGMGMSPMMMGGTGYGMGLLSWVYSLNAMVHSVGYGHAWISFRFSSFSHGTTSFPRSSRRYAINVIGMNSHMLHQLFLQFWTTLQHAVDVVKRSKIRRWFQQKSRRSAALRAAFVVVAMGLAHQVRVRKALSQGRGTRLVTTRCPSFFLHLRW